MSEKLKELFKLQQGDLKVDELKRTLENFPEKKHFHSVSLEYKQAVEKFDKLSGENDGLQKKLKQLEDRINLLEAKINKEEGRLYSGSIVNPKELKGIQDEVQSFKRKKDDLETEELEIMEEADGIVKNLNAAQVLKNSLSERLNTAKKVYEVKNSSLTGQIDDLEKDRQLLTKNIEQNLLEKYERLRTEKHGTAVARLDDGICSGCRIDIPSEEISKINASQALSKCPNCKRMLIPQTVEVE